MSIKILKYRLVWQDGRTETVTGIGNKKDILVCAKRHNIKFRSIKRIYNTKQNSQN